MADFLYPFLSGQGKVGEEELLAQVRSSSREKFLEVCRLRRELLERQGEQLTAAGAALRAAFEAGGRLWAFGNGGSATDATDLVGDLARRGRPAFSLLSDPSVLTALANDVGFENVFARQLRALGRRGDVAVGLSTSGGSANLLAGLEAAQRVRMLTIGLAGYEGGSMAELGLDYLFVVRSQNIPRIQEVHATVYHLLTGMC